MSSVTAQNLVPNQDVLEELTRAPRQVVFKLLRLGIGIGLVLLTGSLLWGRQQNIVSRQGYINASMISLNAPISGNIHLQNLKPGQAVKEGRTVGQIKNSRNPQLETDRQNIETRLETARSQLQALRLKISERQNLVQSFTNQSQTQRSLQSNYYQEIENNHVSELKQVQLAGQLAALEAARYDKLVEQGAVSRQVADRSRSEAKQALALVENKRSQLRQVQAQKKAGNLGLQLENSKTLSYPDIRLQELETELADLNLDIKTTQTQIHQLEIELATINNQLKLQKIDEIQIPQTGVIWSVPARTGNLSTPIAAGDSIIQILDCQDLWATAFISQRDSHALHIGSAAEVKLLDGSNTLLQGRVRDIQAGTGRVTVGKDVAVPPPDLARQEVAVQVTFLAPPQTFGSDRFCGVGQGIEVNFPRK
jgi:multidrug resistance efflux pump